MKLTNKEKYKMLHSFATKVLALSEVYESSATYVDTGLNNKSVVEAFKVLNNRLKSQLKDLR